MGQPGINGPPADGRADASPPVHGRVRDAAPTNVLAVALATSSAYLLYESRHLWFFGDDWAFLVTREVSLSPGVGLLDPHNEHWVALPQLLFRAIYQMIGIDTYWPYALLPIAAHVGSCLLFYGVLRRAGAGEWSAVAAASVLAFAGLAENTLWAFQVGTIGAFGLGLAAIRLVMASRQIVGVAFASILLTLALMCSGMAIPMIMWTGLFAWTRLGIARALAVVVLPGLVYGTWYFKYGRPGSPPHSPATVEAILQFALVGARGVWSLLIGSAFLGALMLVGLPVAVVAARNVAGDLRRLAFTGLAVLLPAYALVGVNRAAAGPDFAATNRYLHVGVVLCLPAFAVALEWVASANGPAKARGIATLAIVGYLMVHGLATTHDFRVARQPIVSPLEPLLRGAIPVIDSGERLLSDRPSPRYNPDITVEALRQPHLHRALAEPAPSPRSILEARAHLQLTIAPSPLDLPPFARARASKPGRSVDLSDCDSIYSSANLEWLQLASGDSGGQIELRTSASVLKLRLVSSDGRGVSRAVEFTVAPGEPIFVASAAPRESVRILLNHGEASLCSPAAR